VPLTCSVSARRRLSTPHNALSPRASRAAIESNFMPTLKETLALARATPVDPLKSIFTEIHPVSFIEFHLNAHCRQGFSLSYLINYRLENILPLSGEVEPQRLTLAFSNADVVISGWRLDNARESLRLGVLSLVKATPDAARYEQMIPKDGIVAKIEISSIERDG
jgi:hypothetical protein